MKVKTSEATPIQLNWMVAKATGLLDAGRVVVDFEYMSGHDPIRLNPRPDVYYSSAYSPTTDAAQAYPIIEREEIGTQRRMPCMRGEEWEANGSVGAKGAGYSHAYGPTPLIAAMRCYVASRLGAEVDVPDELI